MKPARLRGNMVEIYLYKDDLFRKIIEQRKLNKADKKLYYWLKILANSIYGFFVELIPESQNENAKLQVFSGERTSQIPPTRSKKRGNGSLLLWLPLSRRRGAYCWPWRKRAFRRKREHISSAISTMLNRNSENGGSLNIPGSEGLRILKWDEVTEIVERFSSLNPYNRRAVKGSILNLVDANFIDSDPAKPRRQLYGYSIAAKRYALYEKTGKPDITIVDPKAHGIGFLYPPKDSPKDWDKEVPQWIYELWDYIVRCSLNLPRKAPSWLDIPQMMRLTITTYNVLEMLGEWEIARPYNFLLLPMVDPLYGFAFHKKSTDKVLLVCAFSSKQTEWLNLECVNVHDGKKYKMVNCRKTNGNILYNVVFPSQFAHLLTQYQAPRSKKPISRWRSLRTGNEKDR